VDDTRENDYGVYYTQKNRLLPRRAHKKSRQI
jgi:hypothetical protein